MLRRKSTNAEVPDSAVIEHSSLEIKLGRVDRIYRPGEKVSGVVVVRAKDGWSHKGVILRVEGAAKLQLSNRSLGLFESMSTMKPRVLINDTVEVAPPAKLPAGTSEIPFEFPLRATDGTKLHESYHGVYISVSYTIRCECNRGVMKNALEREIEFIVEVPATTTVPADPKPFTITPESLENVRAASIAAIPKFTISGKLHRQACPINLPFTGEVVIEASEAAVRSIELQLVRVESVKHPESGATAREATEIQNIQIGDGDVCRGLVVPIYMIFPRLFSCPTMSTDAFNIEFECNLIVVFADGYMVTENFPLSLFRSR